MAPYLFGPSGSAGAAVTTGWGDGTNGRRLEDDILAIRIALGKTGDVWEYIDGHSHKTNVGDLTVVDVNALSQAGYGAGRIDTDLLMIPKSSLNVPRQMLNKLKYFERHSPLTPLLREGFRGIYSSKEQGKEEDAQFLHSCVVAMLGELVQNRVYVANSGDLKSIRKQTILRALKENLSNPDLDFEELSKQLGISRATLYRDMKEYGGARAKLLEFRLNAAHDLLEATPPTSGRVSEVAYRTGFSDPFHFSKAFRKKFGIAPSDVFQRR
ncbi:L-rhamnose operon regulatory protein RhaS [Ruegeria denitrificans]|uniref:L-rhamnose operon regulatory protein RhaS n=1 Tax=Ruegeria denitrificans TaxID=1715692 RepID=A0A0P1II91_9RHOB|nr:L-rhamnose operon regulatory protein RhaS [Ruegeria denitrificans]